MSDKKPDRPVFTPEPERRFVDDFIDGPKAQSVQPKAAADEIEGMPSLKEQVIYALKQIYDPDCSRSPRVRPGGRQASARRC